MFSSHIAARRKSNEKSAVAEIDWSTARIRWNAFWVGWLSGLNWVREQIPALDTIVIIVQRKQWMWKVSLVKLCYLCETFHYAFDVKLSSV